jgi:aspartyl-tRNA(Asn)/glutamyl-tRNA(Gln) amidotransferase subunit A
MYLCDKYTVTANIAGICGVSVPAGTMQCEGSTLPLSIQLQGPVLGEDMILRVAHQFQQATAFHHSRPPVSGV